MKIIHCGDLHLDSVMKTNLTAEQARERKNEILLTFEKMIEFAKNNEISVIMIAGDLFDTKNISIKTRNVVIACIEKNPQIDFLYLRGNHDAENFLNGFEETPENLKLFSEIWTSFRYDNIVITGVELNGGNSNAVYDSLVLNRSDTNIVMMHGQESRYSGKDRTEVINLGALKNKNIDYLALGHIHSYKLAPLDQRGMYCYCGCLEGRGYDETGRKGFVLLDTGSGALKSEFIPFSRRVIYEISVDVSGMETTNEAAEAIERETAATPKESLVKVVLNGKVSVESERNINYLKKKFSDVFYSFKIYDQTGYAIYIEDYRYDASLKGEFIRLVLDKNYPEQMQKEIIEAGLKSLAGEAIGS
ncbi:metallophosphoesterase family protein [Parasporobacterium paucivorans]|uniref:DNA repair exonuclease SbcCD nuclease subunit n=1 Tax=Parasporobacterium paucivorans DSM 15970 TaxID=1122934 RepID=A0A1M6IFB2_9FIRM|nr:metallophosphoesterase [Parasporobacterium paucivorans]SHJ33129.1 DNA repair exonuclease SbcCD nuclease subunit [Parasporobacterium paucivorans DSM 15970]